MKTAFRLLILLAIAALAGCVIFPIPLPPVAMKELPPVSPTPTPAAPQASGTPTAAPTPKSTT
ncbi:MAG TPA: hypothetical protein VFB33_11350 [Candidatus Binataceae bacterium]|jgi:hypothetical protein|nr:hypothetical protein [Candidatus Binataceae bacterium]